MKRTPCTIFIFLVMTLIIISFPAEGVAQASNHNQMMKYEDGDLYEWESNDDYLQANHIVFNTNYIGNLSDKFDNDYYKFTLDTPGSVLVEFTNPADIGYHAWIVQLYQEDNDGNKEKLDGINAGVSAKAKMDKKRLPAGVYYLRVITYSNGNYTDFDYKLKVNFNAESADSYEQEFNDSYSEAQKIKLGNTYTGNMSSISDKDYYKMTLSKTTNVLIKLKNIENTGDNNWTIYIYKEDADGNKGMLNSYDVGKNLSESFRYSKLSKGTYYIVINRSFHGGYSNSDYQFTVKENKPGKPSKLKASKITSRSFTLSWAKVTDGKRYQIYRSTKKNGEYKLVASVTDTKYNEKNLSSGKNYYYKIRAINDDGYKGAFSTVFSVRTK